MSLLKPYQRFEPIDITERQTNFALATFQPFAKKEVLESVDQKEARELSVQERYDKILNDLDDLADELGIFSVDVNLKITAKCRSCEKLFQLDSELEKADSDYFYCGGSERCLP